ncbi:MAG: hypothetical protein K8R36_14715 [Planctomycetales bacterium]|nr:hypothetical protein [Planctomycetales bacterium]
MISVKFSLRSLLHVVTIVCVAAFCAGGVVQKSSLTVAFSVLMTAGLPYCIFILIRSRGAVPSRVLRVVFFGLGWIWVSTYVLMLMCAAGNDSMDSLSQTLGWMTAFVFLPFTMLTAVLMLRTYTWTCNDANIEEPT